MVVLLLKCKRAKDSFENQKILLKKIKATVSNSTPKFVGFRQQVVYTYSNACSNLCAFFTFLLDDLYQLCINCFQFQDAHEMLSMCLDQLKENVQAIGIHSNNSTHGKTGSKCTDEINSISPVVMNFENSIEHKIICKE